MRSSLAFCLLIGLVYSLPSGLKHGQNGYQKSNQISSRNYNANQDQHSSGWELNKIYEYDVEARALSGINEISKNYSGVYFRAKLFLQRRNLDRVLYAKLRNPQISELHTVLPDDWESEIPESHLDFQPLPASHRPFEIHYDNEDVSYMVVDDQVSDWEINILRAVVTQLQMKLKSNATDDYNDQLKLATSHNVMEDSITGKCQTYYDISKTPRLIRNMQSKLNNDFIRVMKRRDYENCENNPGYSYGLQTTTNWNPDVKMGIFFHKKSLSTVVINGTLSHYTIVSSQTTTTIEVNPHMHNDKNGITGSAMNLTLASIKPEDREPPQIEGKKIYGLSYDYSSSYSKYDPLSEQLLCQSHEDSKSTSDSNESGYARHQQNQHQQNRRAYQKQAISPEMLRYVPTNSQDSEFIKKVISVGKIREITRKIAASVDNPEEIQKKHALELFTILVSVMRTMNREQLFEGGQPFYPNSAYSSKRSNQWKVYRDAVVLTGTFHALDVIREWIENEKVAGVDAADIMASLPRTAQNVTANYLMIYYNLAFSRKVMKQTYLNTTAIISLAHLSRRVLYEDVDYEEGNSGSSEENHDRYSTAQKMIVDKIIPRYVKEMHNAVNNHDHHKIQVYIRALGNFGYRKTVDYFSQYLIRQEKLTDHERVLMVSSMDYLSKHSPQPTHDVLFYVYLDSLRFSSKVRAIAAVQIMRSSPSSKTLQRLASFTKYDSSKQVKNLVKTAIQSAAELKDAEHQELAANARSALPYLSSEPTHTWYSSNVLYSSEKSANIHFFNDFAYVNDDNRRIPDVISYLMKVSKGDFTTENVKVNAMVSDVSEFWKSIQEVFELQHQYGHHSSKNSAYVNKFSKLFNSQSDEKEPLQGNILFQFMGNDRFVTLDESTFKDLNQFWKYLFELSGEKSFEYSKYFDSEEIIIGTPTEFGIPFEYTHKNPTVLKLKAHVNMNAESGDEHSEESGGKSAEDNSSRDLWRKVHKLNANMSLEILYSTRLQAHFGVFTRHNQRHYLSGFDKDVQINLPLNLSLEVDFEQAQVQTTISLLHPEDNTTLLYYDSAPYTAKENILDLTPIVESPDYSVMYVGDVSPVDHILNTTNGFVFRVSGEVDQGFKCNVWQWPSMHKIQTPLFCVPFNDKIHYGQLRLEYVGELSTSHDVSFNISLMNMTHPKACHSSSEENTYSKEQHSSQAYQHNGFNVNEVDFHSQTNQKQRLRQLIRKTAENIPTASVSSVDISVAFSNENASRYTVSAAYASSKVSNEARVVLFYNETQVQSKPFQLYLTASSKAPQSSFLNFDYALNANEAMNVSLQLYYGENYQSGSKINIQAKLNKSEERQQALQNSNEAQMCTLANDQKLHEMYQCENATIRAGLMDRIHIEVEYSNVSPYVRNMTNKVYSFFKHRAYEYLEVNSVNASGSGSSNKINIDTSFEPETFQTANISVKTWNTDAQYTKVPVGPWMQQIVVLHPALSPVQRLKSKALGYNADEASCLVFGPHIQTFSGRGYILPLGRCYRVLFTTPATALRIVPYNVQIEARDDLNPVQKDVRVTIAYEDQKHEILLSPHKYSRQIQDSESNMDVKIDGDDVEITSEGRDIKSSDDAVLGRIYRATEDEVHVDLEFVRVEFDTSRLRIAVNENLRSFVRGLCGTFERPELDFTTPNNTVLFDPVAFGASYAVMDNECQDPAASKLQSYYQNAESYSRSEIKGNTISANLYQALAQTRQNAYSQPRSQVRSQSPSPSRSQSRSPSRSPSESPVQSQSPNKNKQSPQYRQQQASCLKQQTQYVVDQNGQNVCFTVQKLQICQKHCTATKKSEKSVGVYCLPQSNLVNMWKSQIDQGENPHDFSREEPTKTIKMTIHKECSMP